MVANSSVRLLLAAPLFRRFWFSRLVSTLGSVLTRVLLPLDIYQRTGSGSLAATVTTITLAPGLLLGMPAGTFADRHARVKTMRRCDTLSAILTVVLAVVFLYAGFVSWIVFVVVAVVASASVFFDAASFGLLPRLVDRSELGQANALLYGSNTVISFLGPATGGFLYTFTGIWPILIFDALSFAVSAALLVGITVDNVDESPKSLVRDSSFLTDMWAGLTVIRRSRLLSYLVAAGAASGIAGGALSASLVLLVSDRMGNGGEALGLLVSCLGAGAFTGSVVLSVLSSRFSQTTVALFGFPAAAASFLWIALASGPINLFGGCFTWGILYTILIINNVTLRQSILPDSLQARVNATARSIAWGGEPVGAALVAVLVSMTSLTPALLVCAIPFFALSATVWATPLRRRNTDDLIITDPAVASPTQSEGI